MRFTKMQGLGNDFLLIYGPVPEGAAPLSAALCDRHFGVGADGVIPSLPYKRPQTKDGFFRSYEYVYDEYYDCYLC